MHRNIPITFILFLILVVVVSALIENHFKNDYLGGNIWSSIMSSGNNYKFITSDNELNMSVKPSNICDISNSPNKKANTILTPNLNMSLFNIKFLSTYFVYSDNNYYYDPKIMDFNKDIVVPYVGSIDFKYEHIFKWKMCELSTYETYKDNIDLIKLNTEVEKLNNIIDNYESQKLLNRYPLDCYDLDNNKYEIFDSTNLESKFDSLNWFTIFESNQFRNVNFENELFTGERVDYIWFFQYYAKVFIYNIFIPAYSDESKRQLNIIKKSDLSDNINNDITKQNLACYPLVASYGLYVCLVYDPRFGIIIACKGSEGDNEWANNFDKDGVATRVVTNNFHTVLNAINHIQNKYYTQYREYIANIAFTGHSLGGAIAQQLSSLFVYNQNMSPLTKQFRHLHLVTFNSAGVTPFIRNMSLKFLQYNRSKITDPPLNIYNMTIRRRHDPVHQTGHIVFQSLDNYKIDEVNGYFPPLIDTYHNKYEPPMFGGGYDQKYNNIYKVINNSKVLVVPSYSGRAPILQDNKDNLYDWRKDKNLTHIVLLFDEISILGENKFSLSKSIKYIKDLGIKDALSGLFDKENRITSNGIFSYFITKFKDFVKIANISNINSIFTNILTPLASLSSKHILNLHTQHYLTSNKDLFMYYNSKGLRSDSNSIELYRMCLELNKYKIEYIPQFLRDSNIASYVIQLDES